MAPPPWQALNCSFCPPSTVRLPVLCLPLWPCSSYSLLGVSGFRPAHSLGISTCFKWKKTLLNIGVAYPGGWCLNAWLLWLASDTLKMLGGFVYDIGDGCYSWFAFYAAFIFILVGMMIRIQATLS